MRTRLFGSSLYGVPLLVTAGFVFAGCLERRDDDTTAPADECSACHGGLLDEPFQAAPPFNLSGETAPDARANGAHEAHLIGNDRSRSVECSECHLVPEALHDEGHVDTSYPAEVIFKGPARAFKAEPVFNPETGSCEQTFCHGGSFVGFRPSGGTLTEPSWTDVSGAPGECGACHGNPPPYPHPAVDDCHECHKNINEDRSFSHPHLHVDGLVTFFIPGEPR